MFFVEDGKYFFDKDLLRQAHAWCQRMTHSALYRNDPVIVSNTFVKPSELTPYFDIAEKFDILPVVILMQSNFGSVHDVPTETLFKMRKNFCYNIDDVNVKYQNILMRKFA